jgi:hypothetical protein
MLWIFFSFFAVGLYPLWEGRHSMKNTFYNMYLDISGRKKPAKLQREGVIDGQDNGSSHGSVTEVKVVGKE